MKTEAIFSSETSVDFQRTTRRYIPYDSTFQNRMVWNSPKWLQPPVGGSSTSKICDVEVCETVETDKECEYTETFFPYCSEIELFRKGYGPDARRRQCLPQEATQSGWTENQRVQPRCRHFSHVAADSVDGLASLCSHMYVTYWCTLSKLFVKRIQ
jgi:hypothetical protein